MTQVYNQDLIKRLQSNPNVNVFDVREDVQIKKNENHYFQLLIFEDKESMPLEVYGTKKALREYYQLDNDNDFPTSGVKVKENFLRSTDKDEYEYDSMIHWLLQTRKLSQMISYTWLSETKLNEIDDDIKDQVSLVKRILKKPQLDRKLVYVNHVNQDYKQIKDLDELHKEDPNMKLWTGSDSSEQSKYSDFLIKANHINYNFIPLALLLCGQAFYKKNGKYQRIWEPIASIRQVIMELGIEISWDTFYKKILFFQNLEQHW